MKLLVTGHALTRSVRVMGNGLYGPEGHKAIADIASLVPDARVVDIVRILAGKAKFAGDSESGFEVVSDHEGVPPCLT